MEGRPPSSSEASTRHMQTEKRRRDRIASGFECLRELVPCKDRKLDKATFLQEVIEYVGQLQAVVQQAVWRGGLGALPEEAQWQVRLLLPRQGQDAPYPSDPHSAEGQSGQPEAQQLGEPMMQAASVGATGGADTLNDTNFSGSTMPAPANQGEGPQPGQAPVAPVQTSDGTLADQLATAQAAVALGQEPPSGSGSAVGPHATQDSQQVQQPGVDAQSLQGTQERIGQLQQLVRQLQSQQAMSAQQLQLQQAAVMQSQVYNAFRLQQLMQGHRGASEPPSQPVASESMAQAQPPATSTAQAEAVEGQDPTAELGRLLTRKPAKTRRTAAAAKGTESPSAPSSNCTSGSSEAVGQPESHRADANT